MFPSPSSEPGRPAVTVLLPVYNGGRHLRPAIDSILAQSFTDFELLVVDDGSTDTSVSIASSTRDGRVRVVELGRNQGLSTAINRGLGEARGELVARQDADDLSCPTRLEQQVAFLEAHPRVALLGTLGRVIDEAGEFVGVVDRCLSDASIRWYHGWDNPFIHTSVMFRRRVLLDSGGQFDPDFDPFSQDYAMWSRIIRRHEVANLPARLVHYRLSPDSITGAMNVPETAAADNRRPAFVPILRRIVGDNLRAMFGAEAISDRDVITGSGFVLGLDSHQVSAFLAMFFRLLERYREQYPAQTDTAEFRRMIARQLDTVAYRVLQPSRLAAWRIYAAGIRRQPVLALHLPWPRAVALAIFGAKARGAVKRLGVFRRVFAPHL